MTNPADVTSRGPLFPAELPEEFTRVPAGPDAKDVVAWWWISRWSLPEGHTSVQELLAFPSSNLAFEGDAVRYWGPTTKRSTRVLIGRGWVLGALLRPAAVPVFTKEPAACRDGSILVAAPEIHATVCASSSDLVAVVGDVARWLSNLVGPLTDEAHQANQLADLAITDSSVATVSDLADALGVSSRTLNRLSAKYVGLSPYTMIRRRRLQEAVEWTREHAADSLADTAARFGFADQAHLSREARALLGLTLRDYRARTIQQG